MKTLQSFPIRVSFAFLACVLVLGCSSSQSSSGTGTNTPATPLAVTSISPSKIQAGAGSFALTVNGTGFQSGMTLQIGTTTVPATYVGPTQMTANVPAAAVTNGAMLTIVAANANTSSATGSTAVQLEVDNPVPQITGFSPTGLVAASGSSTVTVNGTGFVPSTVIQVNGTAHSTAWTSPTQVTFTVTDADIANGGTLSLVAVNPPPAGGASAASSVPVVNPIPGNVTLSPAIVVAGTSTPTTITATGSNFVSSSIIQVNGTARPTTVISPTQVTFQLTVADQATAAKLSVNVLNPAPSGGTSNTATLTVANPTTSPTITSVSPTQFILKSASGMSVQGKNLDTNCVVNWNGTPLNTNLVSYTISGITTTYLSASVPASLLGSTGSATITVTSPTAPGGSNALTVQIVNPPSPTLSAISPAGVPINTSSTITLTGTGFTSYSTVAIDGTAVTTQYVGTTSLKAQVPSTLMTLPGTHLITVSTPAPGGGVSNSFGFTAYIALPNNAMALNPVNGLLYVSVPSSAGAPYGNSVVSVDPATGVIGTPIPVGSEPDKLAISSDGTTLWVGLDGASTVRRVDLTTGKAGIQFSLGSNVGTYDYPPIVHAIAVLPGTTDSIVISRMNNAYTYQDGVAIYDSGVARPNQINISTISTMPALFVSPSKPEVYVTSYESGYQVLSYNSTGLTHLAGDSGTSVFNGNYGTAVQVDNGRAYLDSGKVLDAETGTLIGTFYANSSTTSTAATGPMVSDSTLGRNFILLGVPSYYSPSSSPQLTIQAFQESDLTPVPSGTIQVGGAVSGTKYGAGNSSATSINGPNPIDTMLRWGSNGIAFRAANGIFSVRSNVVKDLSASTADVAVATNAPASGFTGTNFTVVSTITNNGPSPATGVLFTQTLPTNATLISATASQGTCNANTNVICNVGSLNNGASTTVTLVLTPAVAGNATFSATVAGNETDATASNNTASATTSIAGSVYAGVPQITSLSPAVALAGSQDLALTVNGTGFVNGSTVYWNTTALNTSYVNATQLSANLPSSDLTTLGWGKVSVVTPSPGGGTSNATSFAIYSSVKLMANHLLVDPYSRRLYASVNSNATEVTGNSLVVVDPTSGSLGTPVSAGSQPGKMALTDDGNVMYVALAGADAVARLSMSTQSVDFTFPVTANGTYSTSSLNLRDIAAVPGTENTIAIDLGSWPGTAIYDVDPTHQSATTRSGNYSQNTTGAYTGSSLQFLNSTTMFSFDVDTSGETFNRWTLASTGLSGSYTAEYTLNNFSSFKLRNGMAFADAGGVANASVVPPAPMGVMLPSSGGSTYTGYYGQVNEPDTSLGRSFFGLMTGSGSSLALTLRAFDQNTYMLTDTLALPISTSVSSTPAVVDLYRWGADGLAILRSDGQIMFVRGAFVVPGLLANNSAAVLGSVSASSLTHGSGNTVLTVTGTGFVPGVAMMWNGSYRTTTQVDSTHVTMAIPSTDLASAGTASITAINPGATASNSLTETIQ